MASSALAIDVVSDVVCPWCYIGKRHLERALARFRRRDRVEIAWRSFEQDPLAPRLRDASDSCVARLAEHCRTRLPHAQAMLERVAEVAAGAGLELRFDRVLTGNTFDGHRLSHLARHRGRQGALAERLLRAYHIEGQALGDRDVLAGLAHEVGLDADEVRALLDGDRYATEVRHDEAIARELGVTGVPFFVFGGRFGVSGAQPIEVLLGALERGWAELRISEPEPALFDDVACALDGCA